MKKNNIDDIVMFLVNNMVNTKIKKCIKGTEVEFIDYINDHTMATLYFSLGNGIEVVHDVLEYLCTHQDIYQELKNRINKYYDNNKDAIDLAGRLDILANKTNHVKQTLTYEYAKKVESYHPNVDYIEFVLTKLTREDILKQLAEEASEVANVGNNISMSASFIAQYALKDIRATCNTVNMTPEPIENIKKELNGNVEILNTVRTKELEEECGDLNMCLDLLYHLEGNHPIEEFNTLDNPKWKRWAERLGFISF